MNIAFDIDEVLLSLVDTFCLYHNDRYKTNVCKTDFTSYNFWEVLGGTKEEMVEKVWKFYHTPYFRQMQPLPGMQQATQNLKSNHTLSVLTSRPSQIEKITEQSMQQHYPHRFTSLTLTNQFFGQNPRLKSSVCVEQGIDLIVEDSLMHAYDCAAAGIQVVLVDFNYPWNQTTEALPGNIIRVHSCAEMEEEIERYGRDKRRKG